MENIHIQNRKIKAGTKKVFKNPLLERLTRSHIAVPISIFLVFSVVLIYQGIVQMGLSAGASILIFITGLLIFSLLEYLVHRHVFHMLPDTIIKEKIQYNFHGIHHEYPKDKDRLAMPPLISILLAITLFYVFRYFIGDFVYAFLPGIMFGYASYLFVHYAVHAFQPPKNFLKILWINHGIHHYKNQEVAFGVSSPLWDYIFRTTPKNFKT
jgi:sterol desaturase/sphingolipid hydroxylase (fatty acid hydroxylase superfamily)